MQPYRTVSPAKPEVVRYLPLGPVGTGLWLVGLLGAFALNAAFALADIRAVRLECDRAAGTCEIISSWWGLLSSTTTVELSSIRSARLESGRAKHGYYYDVVLDTTQGDVRLSRRSSATLSPRAAQRADIDAFLHQPKAPRLGVLYDEPTGAGELVLAFSVVWLIAGWAGSRSARVEVDRGASTLTVTQLRWPLPPRRAVYPLASVRDAVVMTGRGSKGGTLYSVGLVIDGREQPVPIIDMKSSGRGSKERAAERIRAMVQRTGPPAEL